MIWNRDVNASRNMLYLGGLLLHNIPRPSLFSISLSFPDKVINDNDINKDEIDINKDEIDMEVDIDAVDVVDELIVGLSHATFEV